MARAMKDSGIPWIGEIPLSWEIAKVSRFFEIQLGKMLQPMKMGESDTLEKYLCAANLGGNKLKLDELKEMWISDAEKSKFLVRKGDLLVVEGGDIASSDVLSQEVTGLYIQNALHRVRSYANFDVRFLRYYLIVAKARGYIDLICNKATIAHFTKEKFGTMPYVVAPVDEQELIADFLDTECARIDAVMEQTRVSIEEYKKLKQSIITEAVTKGIRPNRPMKDSGIDWIGQIPADWNVQRIKTIFGLRDERNYLPLDEVNLISLYTDQGVVQHADLEQTTGNKASNAEGYKKVYPGDIVVNIILCWMGAIGRSEYEGVTSPAYDVYIPTDTIDSRFYHHYFRTAGFSGDCYKRGKGIMAMRWRTYSDQFRDIPVAVPSIEEQHEILHYLDGKTKAIDALVKKKKTFLSEMDTYKKSLIFEYVTGKKEALICLKQFNSEENGGCSMIPSGMTEHCMLKQKKDICSLK